MKAQFLVVTAVAWLLGAGDGKGGGQTKEDSIQGVWIVVSHEDGGKKENVPKDARITITKDKMTMHAGGKTIAEYQYQLEPSKNPKWIDITARGDKMPGIYELKNDVLRICTNENPKGKRSTRFESKPNSENEVLMVLKRAKP